MFTLIRNLAAAMCIAYFQPVQAATISFDSLNVQAGVGDNFNLSLVGRDFADSLDGGSVVISFDPNLIQVTSVAVDHIVWDFESDPPSPVNIDNLLGRIDNLEFNTLQDVSGNFPIANVSFTAIALGNSNLVLSPGANPFGSGGNPLPVTLVGTQVAIVPIPSSIALLLGSLPLLGTARSRRTST